MVWEDLQPGSYTVSEMNPGDEWLTEISGSPAMIPITGGMLEASVTNTRKRGGLQVSKSVDWGDNEPDPDKFFNICIRGPSHPETPNCQDIGYTGGMLSWSDLIPGLYIVTETSPGMEWQVTVGGSPADVPANGETGNATVANVWMPPWKLYLPLVIR